MAQKVDSETVTWPVKQDFWVRQAFGPAACSHVHTDSRMHTLPRSCASRGTATLHTFMMLLDGGTACKTASSSRQKWHREQKVLEREEEEEMKKRIKKEEKEELQIHTENF